VHFAPRLKGFYLELGTGARIQKIRVMGLPGRERSLTIISAVWIQCTNVTQGRTDRRTDAGRQQRPLLRIALRDKNRIQKPDFRLHMAGEKTFFALHLGFGFRFIKVLKVLLYNVFKLLASRCPYQWMETFDNSRTGNRFYIIPPYYVT